MVRAVVVSLLAAIISACGASPVIPSVTPLSTGNAVTPGVSSTPSAAPSNDPYAGLPSNACGGFHLKIVNDTDAAVTVHLNGTWSKQVGAGDTTVIVRMFASPEPPEFPWDVVISDAQGGQILEGTAGDTPVDQKITVTNGGATQAPYSLQDEGC
ncbi:MAG TPA: hypothetical protein VH371_09970 [Candidatus Limnocylindrales bacterium]